MEPEDIVKKIISGLSNMSENLNVIEREVDVNLQMKYFEFSRTLKKSLTKEEIPTAIEKLQADISDEDQKEFLVLLSQTTDVKAYRAIEHFTENSEGEMKDWAYLALHEAKILLQGDLLGENQMFISTGLGGSGNSLRYFITLFANSDKTLETFQQKVINTELSILFKEYKAELEEIKFINNFVTLVVLIPFKVPINEVFSRAIEAINEFGNFMSFNFLLNNAKRMTPEEIKEFIDKEREKKDKLRGGKAIDNVN